MFLFRALIDLETNRQTETGALASHFVWELADKDLEQNGVRMSPALPLHPDQMSKTACKHETNLNLRTSGPRNLGRDTESAASTPSSLSSTFPASCKVRSWHVHLACVVRDSSE